MTGAAQEAKSSAGSAKARLEIAITGFENDAGDAKIGLFTTEGADAFPDGFKHARRFIKVPIKGKRAHLTISDLPYGVYAVSAFHDEDGDGQLNTGLFGIPTEAVGASRNPSGKPDFDDSRFNLDGPQMTIKIKVSEVF